MADSYDVAAVTTDPTPAATTESDGERSSAGTKEWLPAPERANKNPGMQEAKENRRRMDAMNARDLALKKGEKAQSLAEIYGAEERTSGAEDDSPIADERIW